MLFILGTLAFLQTTLLPGLLILSFFKLRWRLAEKFLFAFGFSLVANYLLGLILTVLHLYTRTALIAVIVIEVAGLAYLYRQTLWRRLETSAGEMLTEARAFLRSWLPGEDEGSGAQAFSRLLLGAMTLVVVIYAASTVWWGIKVWFNGLGTVIDHWDAVVSWNAWAVEWAQNTLPVKTWEYPQLIPINLSVSYLLLGTSEMQFFNTAVMSLFTLMILLALFDLAVQHRTIGYFIGVVAAKFILKKFTGLYMNTAYVDIPLAFFAFGAWVALLQARKQEVFQDRKSWLWGGALLAAGAALTKQGGLLLLALWPLFSFVLAVQERPELPPKVRKQLTWLPFAAGLLLVVPWYLYVEVGVLTGALESNIAWVSEGIYQGKGLLERFLDAFRSLGVYGYLLALVLLGGFWLEKAYRWMVYAIILPYYLAWAFYFSYSPRNLSLIFPFWGLAIGLVAEKLLQLALKSIERMRLARLKQALLPLLLVVLVAVGSLVFTDQRLSEQHELLKKQILDSKLDTELYDYFEATGRVEPILTNYPVGELPGLLDIQVSFQDRDHFFRVLSEHPEARLILMPNDANAALKSEISELVEAGAYEQIFKVNKYTLIRILEP